MEREVSGVAEVPRARRDLVLQELGDEGLLYDRAGALVHILNLTALFVWKRCDGVATVESISDSIRRSFSGTDGRDLRGDVEGVLERFAEKGLLETR